MPDDNPATGAESQTGEQSAENSSSADVGEMVRTAVQEATAPLLDEVGHLKNQVNQLRRKQKLPTQDDQTQTSEAADDTASDDGDELSKLSPEMRKRIERQDRQLKALQEENERRTQAELKRKVGDALAAQIADGKYENADLLKLQIEPHLIVDEDGKVVYDDGETVKDLASVVKEKGKRDIFQPASAGEGAGVKPSEDAATTSETVGGDELTSEDILKMTPEQRRELRARIKRDARLVS